MLNALQSAMSRRPLARLPCLPVALALRPRPTKLAGITRRWSLVALMVLLLVTVAPGSVGGQVTFACPNPDSASPAATAAASPAPDEAISLGAPLGFPPDGGELTVFAAASLTDAFTEIETGLETANPDLAITYNFAGSPALVTQLAEGAKADVVALASERQMTAASDEGLIAGTASVFARNSLTIVTPDDNPANIATPADLGREGVKLVLAAAEVPAGQYAREAICRMAAEPATHGEDFAARVAANVVSEEDNVKATLAKVQLGEADASIVYTTDVANGLAGDVQVVAIPDAFNVIAHYPIAAVEGGNPDLANAFIAHILGTEGQAVLIRYGFLGGVSD